MARPRIDIHGRLPAHAYDAVAQLDASVRLQTVLSTSLRDRAALQGLLRRLHDLAIDLVELRQPPGNTIRPTGDDQTELGRPRAAPIDIELTVDGAVGDLALTSLAEQVAVTPVRTTMQLADSKLLGQVLVCLVDAGARIQHVTDATGPDDRPADACQMEWLSHFRQ